MADAKREKPRKPGQRPDLASLGGLAVAVGGILAGLTLDGGKVLELGQCSAALIVFGGTIGAVMLTSSLEVLIRAVRRIGSIFFERSQSPEAVIDEIIGYAAQARKQGIVSLEQQAAAAHDPFLRKALNLAVDGIDMSQIRSIMELEITLLEQNAEAESKVFEAAGGYAPTVGIVGAVLGLMQVMKNLANIDEVGRGIAAAFVATVYGVGSANIFFLPAANKLRVRTRDAVQIREVMLEGVLAIVEGLNPKLIRTRLEAYERQSGRAAPASKAKAKAKAGPAGAPVSAEG
ncbi:MAG: flagellar motor protein [Bryobacteraceae bacterium]|jgi:chemotaxis protein MotA